MKPFSMNFVAGLAELLTTALVHFVWQGAVLALMLLVTVKLFNVRTARLRYLLSVGTLLVMGMSPVVTMMLHQKAHSQPEFAAVALPSRSAPIGNEDSAPAPTGPILADFPRGSTAAWNPTIEVYVLLVWLVGVSILSTRLAIGFGVTLWSRVNIRPLSDEFEDRVRILGERLKVDARHRVFACVRVGQAVAVGFIRPVVLIPASWLTQLPSPMLEAIIAHELAHIRRWDLWVNLVQRVIETLLFYHPAVWWISSRIRLEREMCCDEIAALCFDRVLYARSLESVAKIGQGSLLMATSISGGNQMKLLTRIRYLFGLAPAESAGNWWSVGFVSMILPFAAAVAFSLPAAATPPAKSPAEDSAATKATQKTAVKNQEVTVKKTAEPEASKKIVTISPQVKPVTITEQFRCQIQSQRHLDVRSLETGYLQSIHVKEGQAVKAGDVLLQVLSVLHTARREAAVAERDLARIERDNIVNMAAKGTVSPGEVKLYQAKLAKFQAHADLAEAELNFTRVRAPFDGIIDLLKEQGSLVKEGEILATLSDNSVMRVYFNVSEARYLEHMTDPSRRFEDRKIELMLANGKKFGQPGKFTAIKPDFNNVGAIPFRADFPNPDRLLRHGQSGTVLISQVLKDALVIPQRTTFELLGKHYVFVVDNDNVAHQREVVIQNETEDLFVIKKGVGPNDKILVEGIRHAGDGEKLKSKPGPD